jgi:hypothetical protein
MQGTFRLMSMTLPFGSVSLKVPPENAQMVSDSVAFARRARS